MIRLLLICLLLVPLPLRAEEVVAGLSQSRVAISANFDGSEILIFGAVKRDVPVPPDAPPLQVVIAVAGPSLPVTMRRKERRFGIWVNVDTVEVDSAPVFYAIVTSAPFREVISNVEDLRHQISINRAIRSVGAPMDVSDAESFTEALIRIREGDGLYQLQEATVTISEETLFNASIALPANLREGNYTARIFLTRGGGVVDEHRKVIFVQKVGLERFLYNLARDQPLIYGLLSLSIAIAAGWAASVIFRYLRG